MDTDFDPLDEIFAKEAVKTVRAVGKFQPKAKFKPTVKKQSAATSVSTSQAAQTIDSTQSELSEPVGNAKPSEKLVSGSDGVPNNGGGWQTSMEKSVGESSDVIIPVESLGDFQTSDMESVAPNDLIITSNDGQDHTNDKESVREDIIAMDTDFDPLDEIFAVKTVRAVGKFQPKAKFKPTVKKQSAATSVSTSQAAQTIDSTQSELSESVGTTKPSDILVSGLDVVPNNDGGLQVSMEKSIGENSDVFIRLDGRGDFQTSGMELVSPNDLFVPSNAGQDHVHDEEFAREEIEAVNNILEEDPIPTFQEDIVLDLSSLDFTHTVATSERPSNEEPVNLMEEGVHEIPTKLASRRAKTGTSNTETASDPSPEQKEMGGRSLRPRKNKTNFCKLVDEDAEVSEEPLLEEENINKNEESQVGSEPPKKNSKRKSKKNNDDKEKPTRKRKKVNEASDKEAVVAKPKKFSHSTRRNRVVDRALLMAPEEEIDYQTVPLRDLIARADYIEKQTKKDEAAAAAQKKDEAAAAAQVRNQSTGTSSGLYNEEETFVSKQDREFNDEEEPGSPIAEDTTEYFNYQTYMVKAPSTRWSKQDTELFYEAVRQFGTDLSMIQHRFPDRERRQLKRKYKKEEREHPMRLRDALTNRTKDLSHLEELVKLIKQQEAEEKENAEKENPVDLTDSEVADEGTLDADGKEPKDEDVQGEENNDGADDAEEENDDDGGDGSFNWDLYKSDV